MSSALIEGVARAGNGFAQSVGEGEKLDGKVIRMLKGALTPDNGAYTIEIQYQKDEGEDYILVERVTDSLRIMAIDGSVSPNSQLGRELAASPRIPTEGKGDADTPMSDADGQARCAHLPTVTVPKLLQTPQNIPPLYPFSRTTVYILISPDASRGTPKSIILKGDSGDNPFEMEIPVEVIDQPSETIQHLAAKKAVAELEEGRGWLVHASDDQGTLVKAKYGEKFESIVEREAVRLGVEYQIAGKYTSFVAVESNTENPEYTKTLESDIGQPPSTDQLADTPDYSLSSQSYARCRVSSSASGSSLFGSAYSNSVGQLSIPTSVSYSMASPMGAASSNKRCRIVQTARQSTGGMAPRKQLATMAARRAAPSAPPPPAPKKNSNANGRGLLGGGGAMRHRKVLPENTIDYSDEEIDADVVRHGTVPEEKDPLQKLIALQTFEGFWEFDAPLLNVVAVSGQHKVPEGLHLRLWATILAITYLEKKMRAEKEAWEMCVDKAKGWLAGDGVEDGKAVDGWWKWAEKLVTGTE